MAKRKRPKWEVFLNPCHWGLRWASPYPNKNCPLVTEWQFGPLCIWRWRIDWM